LVKVVVAGAGVGMEPPPPEGDEPLEQAQTRVPASNSDNQREERRGSIQEVGKE